MPLPRATEPTSTETMTVTIAEARAMGLPAVIIDILRERETASLQGRDGVRHVYVRRLDPDQLDVYYRIDGQTYPARTQLRAAGWAWDALRQTWQIDDISADPFGGHYPGCRVMRHETGAEPAAYWTSKTYAL